MRYLLMGRIFLYSCLWICFLCGCVYVKDLPHASDTPSDWERREDDIAKVYATNWLKKRHLTLEALPGMTIEEVRRKCGKPSRALNSSHPSCQKCERDQEKNSCPDYCQGIYEEWFYPIPYYGYMLGSGSITIEFRNGVVADVKYY
jgi:hypothetical protein